jgi:hypothetical protein
VRVQFPYAPAGFEPVDPWRHSNVENDSVEGPSLLRGCSHLLHGLVSLTACNDIENRLLKVFAPMPNSSFESDASVASPLDAWGLAKAF